MKKVLLFAACSLLGLTAGAGLYGWRQATYVPSQYQLSGASLPQIALNGELNQKLAAQAGEPITLDEREVSQLLAQGLASEVGSPQILQAVQGIDTSIQAERIQTGVVMNLSDIPPEALSPKLQRAIARLAQTLPVLMDREVYISISGQPQVEAGRLVLDQNASVQVGRLQLPLLDLADQLGITPEELEDSLASYIARSGIDLESLDLEDGQIVINGPS